MPRHHTVGHRPLGQPGQPRQEQLRRDLLDREVVGDRDLQPVTGQRSARAQFEQIPRVLTEQRHEPQRVGARAVDDQVEAVGGFQRLPTGGGAQCQPDPTVSGHRVRHPATQVPDAVIDQQGILHARGKDPAVGACHRVAPFGQREIRPSGRVGEQHVLEIAFAAGEERDLWRDHRDRRDAVPEQLVERRGRALAAADHPRRVRRRSSRAGPRGARTARSRAPGDRRAEWTARVGRGR